jgi:hypothetical protein
MTFIHALLAAALSVGATAPHHAAKATNSAARQDALVTVTKSITTTVQDDRTAAVTYLDDTLSLLSLAQAHLADGHADQGRAELMSASGKLSTAHLLLFKDRDFSRAIAPLSIRAEEAYQASRHDASQARDLAEALASDLRPIYRTQTARLGGGAGSALEPLNNIRR